MIEISIISSTEGSFNLQGLHHTIQPLNYDYDEQSFKPEDGILHQVNKQDLPKEYHSHAKKDYLRLKEQMTDGRPGNKTKHRQKRATTVASYHPCPVGIGDSIGSGSGGHNFGTASMATAVSAGAAPAMVRGGVGLCSHHGNSCECWICNSWMAKSNNVRDDALTKIKYYYLHMINGVDLAYKSIDSNTYDIKITPFLTEYHIAETKEASTWTVTSITQTADTVQDTVVDASVILDKLEVWKTTGGRSWKNPDHAMLWTIYDIYGSSKSTVGFAPVTGICRGGRGTAVIEESGLGSWAIAAHELGHNLGARHDESGNSCVEDDMYIMTPTIKALTMQNLANAFTFSPCSIEYFKTTLSGADDQFPRVCVTDRVCTHSVPTDQLGTAPGTIYTLDEQCAFKYGDNFTYYTRDPLDTVCFKMQCLDPPQQYIYSAHPGAIFGTPCGDNKMKQIPAPLHSCPQMFLMVVQMMAHSQ
ncbi:A disintegrin and metalloproteinase with thrombospondin motifs adt-1 [Lamellibrachia satsuma]|nr:A disintegrin and metalloproteinase with thrombospondin motifs adt-1 [Lamellibrachia satsuma]